MASERKEIRQAVIALLKAGNTAAGDRVFSNRPLPLWKGELPALLVYTSSERSEIFNEAPRRVKHTLELRVEAMIEANDLLDDALDDLGGSIETILARDETFGDRAEKSYPTNMEMTLVEDGEKLYGMQRLTYTVEYLTYSPTDEGSAATDDFDLATVTWDTSPVPANQPEASDTIELAQ